MGYKKGDKTISFAELSLLSSIENNRSVKMMERISKAVNWERIEALLKEYYHSGQSHEGADAYSPLMLLKCVVLIAQIRDGHLLKEVSFQDTDFLFRGVVLSLLS